MSGDKFGQLFSMPYQVGQPYFPIQGQPRNPAGDPIAVYDDKLPANKVPTVNGFVIRELADRSGVLICLFRPSHFIPYAATVLLTHCCFGLIVAEEAAMGNQLLRKKVTDCLNALAEAGKIDMDYAMGDPLNPLNKPEE